MNELAWILFLPLAGFLFNGLLGRKLPKGIVSVVGCLAVAVPFGFALAAAWPIFTGASQSQTLSLWTWMSAGTLEIGFDFRMDPLSAVMTLVVTGVGGLIHLYSTGYMKEDPGYGRYFAYLNLFTFFMLSLVLGDNLPVLFLGWEGVGLCSYLLIGFWFKDPDKAAAGMKAFIVNRIGDAGFLVGMFLLFSFAGTLAFPELAVHVEETGLSTGIATAITLCLFIGAMGKSAQLPLYVWLPDAMAGPTPVSALIHAATMVTAGVYMVARMHFLYELAPFTMHLIAIIGGLTALYAATIALAQNNIKKVLAYSTVSQLGYMFLALGCGAFTAGIFHLVTHAFFKAVLFLAAGSVIHAMHNTEDMNRMGGLKRKMPATYWITWAAVLAIAGCPLFSGFFSKEEILASAWAHAPWLWIVGWITAGLTACYMFRLQFLTFFGEPRDKDLHDHAHESPWTMTVPMGILAILSVVGGVINLPAEHGGALANLLSPLFHAHHPDLGGLKWVLEGAAVGIAAVGAFVAWKWLRTPYPDEAGGIRRLLENQYYLDLGYRNYIVRPFVAGGSLLWVLADVVLIDGLVNLLSRMWLWISDGGRSLVRGTASSYVMVFLGGTVILFAWLFS